MTLGSARLGMHTADRMLNHAAGKIAEGGAESGAAPMIELRMAKLQQSASVAVARTMSETLGTLVNLHV